MDLRSPDIEQFFLNYQNGKSYKQVVGINKIGEQPKIIAQYLKLPNPELFTGHCFRRTGATILADAGGDTLTVKNFGGWKSTQVMETYVEESLHKKEKIGNTILNSIRNSKVPIIQSMPSTSSTLSSHPSGTTSPSISTHVSTSLPFTVEHHNLQADLDVEQTTNNNLNTIYQNCTFHSCTFVIKK
jgi:hypothetical protein